MRPLIKEVTSDVIENPSTMTSFAGWVKPEKYCWVSLLNPTYIKTNACEKIRA